MRSGLLCQLRERVRLIPQRVSGNKSLRVEMTCRSGAAEPLHVDEFVARPQEIAQLEPWMQRRTREILVQAQESGFLGDFEAVPVLVVGFAGRDPRQAWPVEPPRQQRRNLGAHLLHIGFADPVPPALM